jgi:hypothetical protein
MNEVRYPLTTGAFSGERLTWSFGPGAPLAAVDCPRCPNGSLHGTHTATYKTPDGVLVRHRSKLCGDRATFEGETLRDLLNSRDTLGELEATATATARAVEEDDEHA